MVEINSMAVLIGPMMQPDDKDDECMLVMIVISDNVAS